MALFSQSLSKNKRIDKFKNKAGELLNRTLDKHVSLAVTGLSRSGKTAFITSLVNQLVNEGNNSHLSFFDPIHQGNFIAAKRVPQKNLNVPRFDYESAMQALTAENAQWPEPTSGISELRLAIRYQPKQSVLKYATDTINLTLDITDYPGEWLLDLPMLKQTYQEWSQQTHELMVQEPRAEVSQTFLAKLHELDPFAEVSEELLAELSQEYTQLLHVFRHELGLSVIQPGRFILPGDLAGAPILEFFPFPELEALDANDYQNAPDSSLIGMLRARFIEYKEQVVKKFYKEHFVNFDRQIVLADCLTPLNRGKACFKDLELAMSMVLASYQYGKSGLFSRLFSPKIDKLLFAATKADHVTSEQHGAMVSLLNELVYPNKQTLTFEKVEMQTLAIASVKATNYGRSHYQGKEIPVIQGTKLLKNNQELSERITLFPGSVPTSLPDDDYWQQKQFNFVSFAPLSGLNQYQCLPHMRMDQVLQFLLADKML